MALDIMSYLLGKLSGSGGDPHEQEYTEAAYAVCEEKGATMPEEQTLQNLAGCIDTIPGAEIIPPEAGDLTSIVVGTFPTKTTYIEGDALDLTGCVILGNFSNGYQLDVTQRCTFICNDPVTYSDTKIVVSLTIGSVTKTLDIPIVVNGEPQPVPASTKGLWHFDDGTDKNEINGKGTSASGLVDPIAYSSSYLGTGKFDLGMKGSNVWLSYGNTLGITNYQPAQLAVATFTLEFWVKFENTSNLQIPIRLSNASNNSSGITLRANGGNFDILNYTNLFPGATMTAVPIETNKWYHFALVFNAGVSAAYLNGHKIIGSVSGSFSSSCALNYLQITENSSSEMIDEVLVTESAKYVADFEPPHAEYYIPQGGE